jgi:nucleotide-binding universal stress UspA family protein
MDDITTILHPTDFSPHAAQAFELACSLSRERGARLVLLHVVQPPLTTLGGMPGVPPFPIELGLDEIDEKLRRLQASQPALVACSHQVEVGDPAATILRVAREIGCDFIVIGTHGRTGLMRLLMGSVAEQVVRRAACPVITVKSAFSEDVSDLRVLARERV